VFTVPARGTYSPPQTLLLDLSGPLGGGEGNVERGRRERKKRKEKGGIEKGGVALVPQKILRAPTLQFITKLVYRWNAECFSSKCVVRSEFHCVYI